MKEVGIVLSILFNVPVLSPSVLFVQGYPSDISPRESTANLNSRQITIHSLSDPSQEISDSVNRINVVHFNQEGPGCCICHEQVSQGLAPRKPLFSCQHHLELHKDCIKPWITYCDKELIRRTCPICREIADDENVSTELNIPPQTTLFVKILQIRNIVVELASAGAVPFGVWLLFCISFRALLTYLIRDSE